MLISRSIVLELTGRMVSTWVWMHKARLDIRAFVCLPSPSMGRCLLLCPRWFCWIINNHASSLAFIICQAALTENQRLDGLQANRHLLLTALEAGRLKSGCQRGWVPVRTLFHTVDCRFLVPTWDRKQRQASSLMTFIRTLISFMRPLPSQPHRLLITSPKLHLILSHWAVGFQDKSFGGYMDIQSITLTLEVGSGPRLGQIQSPSTRRLGQG